MEIENERVRRVIKLLIVLAALTVIVFVWTLLKNRDTSINDIIGDLRAKPKLQDSYNGIYVYEEPIGEKRYISKNCTFSYIDNYLIIVDDDYYLYRSSCMGTYFKGSGKISDLNIANTSTEYYVIYNDLRYNKTIRVKTVYPNNAIESFTGALDINNLKIITKETQFDGNYYLLKRKTQTSDKKGGIDFTYEHQADDTFLLSFLHRGETVYSYTIRDMDMFPEYYHFGDILVTIEKGYGTTRDKYGYKLKAISKTDGVIYDLDTKFPIMIDDVKIDTEHYSIYIYYEQYRKYFRIFAGNDKKFCKGNGDSNRIAYYEFRVGFDSTNKTLEKPVYVKTGYENESCSYIEQFVKGG